MTDGEGGLDGHDLHALAERTTAVPGVVGVTLGGSRARGEHAAVPGSARAI